MQMRLIDIDYTEDPHLNLAIDEAIFLELMKGNSPSTFRTYGNASSVVLGCFQIADEEIDIKYAITKDVKIAKRFTGGGATYCDGGALNFSITSRETGAGDVQRLFSKMMGGALSSLRIIGVDAAVEGLNSISVNGRKVMNAAATARSGAALFQASMLVSSDLNALASVLKMPGAKKADGRLLGMVANIRDISEKGTVEVKKAVLEGYGTSLGFEYATGKLTEREAALARKLQKAKYQRSEWNLGREFTNVE
ncbi:MAG: lipoate--protein ligase family protein [Candidatus Micrarchaeaceae archaeon]